MSATATLVPLLMLVAVRRLASDIRVDRRTPALRWLGLVPTGGVVSRQSPLGGARDGGLVIPAAASLGTVATRSTEGE